MGLCELYLLMQTTDTYSPGIKKKKIHEQVYFRHYDSRSSLYLFYLKFYLF